MDRLLRIRIPLGKTVNADFKLLDADQIAPAIDAFQEILADLPELEEGDTLSEAYLARGNPCSTWEARCWKRCTWCSLGLSLPGRGWGRCCWRIARWCGSVTSIVA
jgi:hypothetical protein